MLPFFAKKNVTMQKFLTIFSAKNITATDFVSTVRLNQLD